jgi:hypothetical protein
LPPEKLAAHAGVLMAALSSANPSVRQTAATALTKLPSEGGVVSQVKHASAVVL